MGFDDEETQYEFHGNVGEVTTQIGNAVPVNLAAALVKATLGEGRPRPNPPGSSPGVPAGDGFPTNGSGVMRSGARPDEKIDRRVHEGW